MPLARIVGRPIAVIVVLSACTFFVAGHCYGASSGAPRAPKASSVDWPVYGGSAKGDRYSELSQINRANVKTLQAAWRYEAHAPHLQTSPIVVDGTLYAYAAGQRVVALDAATGEQRWQSDPAGGQSQNDSQPVRGLSYWKQGNDQRLFVSGGTHLYALNAVSGQLIKEFGEAGRIDLRQNLGRDYSSISTFLTSPGTIYKDVVIVGFRTSETQPAAPGAVRAYDVRTGKLRWNFSLLPRPGEDGHESWPKEAWKTNAGANAWAGFALDETRGILFVPTGSAVDDFYGADRLGNNLYANSLVALNAQSGQKLWHYQIVHHDLWDRDLPSPPVLLSVSRNGQRADVVAQATKHGFIFVFDGVRGKPWFPIEERAVPASDVPGEQASPTQPFPIKPKPFARNELTADLVTNRTQQARTVALREFESFNNRGIFTPLMLDRPTVVFPGFDGGAEWGGAAVDRTTGVLYINSNDVVSLGTLVDLQVSQTNQGRSLYTAQCGVCHGLNREGSPPEIPSLQGVTAKRTSAELRETIASGRGRMPGFPQLPRQQVDALLSYLGGDGATASAQEFAHGGPMQKKEASQGRYYFTGYKKWRDNEGYPAVKPPWGTLNAIDLNSGEYLWKVPLGEYPELSAQGVPITGTENYGGPVVTAGGLVFIGSTIFDRKLRAFDSRTGKTLWEFELPYAGIATPITFMIKGQQYVVIACSGGRDSKGPQGSAYMAFALPRVAEGSR